METKLLEKVRLVLARLLGSTRKQVRVGVGVQGSGRGKRSFGNFGWNSRAWVSWGMGGPCLLD